MSKHLRKTILALIVIGCFACVQAQTCSTCDPADVDDCESLGGYWKPIGCFCYLSSPIIIDLSGNGFELTTAGGGVEFDIGGSGTRERIGWTAEGSDEVFLALDRNGNGLIDDGTELFGNYSPQPPSRFPNGFTALSVFDQPAEGGNANGLIDANDRIFRSLLLWRDSNHNGLSEANEFTNLAGSGVTSIAVEYRTASRRDKYGNLFRYRSKVHSANIDGENWAYDVFLTSK